MLYAVTFCAKLFCMVLVFATWSVGHVQLCLKFTSKQTVMTCFCHQLSSVINNNYVFAPVLFMKELLQKCHTMLAFLLVKFYMQ